MFHCLLAISLASLLFSAGCTERSTALLTTDSAIANPLADADFQPYTVQLRPLVRQLHLHGRVVTNADQTAPVYPLVGGVVEQVPVQLGDQVAKGQVLALIRSSEVAELQNQHRLAAIELETARQHLAATTSLFADGLASERDLHQAQATRHKADQALLNYAERLSIYDVSAAGLLPLRTPVAGIITEKNVAPRTQLNQTNQERLFTISGLQQVWVVADVFQADVPAIEVGDTATISTLADPDHPFTGQVDKVFHLLDPKTKTMRVRVRLANAALLLKPGMYARVQVRGQVESQLLPAVPKNSVLFVNGRRVVLVVNEQQELVTRDVQLSATSGELRCVTSGLRPGERVATRNPLLLYQELNP